MDKIKKLIASKKQLQNLLTSGHLEQSAFNDAIRNIHDEIAIQLRPELLKLAYPQTIRLSPTADEIKTYISWIQQQHQYHEQVNELTLRAKNIGKIIHVKRPYTFQNIQQIRNDIVSTEKIRHTCSEIERRWIALGVSKTLSYNVSERGRPATCTLNHTTEFIGTSGAHSYTNVGIDVVTS